MTDESDRITARQALAYAGQLGIQVSPTQFERWRKYGLLPRPIDRPGGGRGKGRKGRYDPLVVVPLLVAIAALDPAKRHLDRTAWELWSLGLPVTRAARRAIDEYLEREGKKGPRRLGKGGADSGRKDAEAPIDRLAYARLPPWLGRVRRRIGRPQFAGAARLLQEMALGAFRTTSPRDRPDFEALAEVFSPSRGAKRARAGGSSVASDLDSVIQMMSERANLQALRQAVGKAPDRLLEAVRDEARAAWRVFCDLSGQPVETPLPMPFFLMWAGALHASDPFRSRMIDFELTGNEAWAVLKRTPLEQRAIDHPEERPVIDLLRQRQAGVSPNDRATSS